jgi:hypothetical protein
MFGVNQAECCSGETAETGPLTAEVAGSQPAGSSGFAPVTAGSTASQRRPAH